MKNSLTIKDRIKESGLKQFAIARELGVTSYTLQKKLENKTEFKISEVIVLSQILNLSDSEIVKLFFPRMVNENNHNRRDYVN